MLSDGHSEVTYGKIEFTYDNKEKAEIVEWTEKRIDKEICIYLQHHLHAQSIEPSDIEHVQVVVGGALPRRTRVKQQKEGKSDNCELRVKVRLSTYNLLRVSRAATSGVLHLSIVH